MGDETRDWLSHLAVFVNPGGSEASQAASFAVISKLLLDKTITIQDTVTAAGPYLTQTDISVRARGILLLGELLVNFASTPLEDNAVHSLAEFFTAKLADLHCLRGTLIGCTALLRRSPQIGAVQGNDVKSMAKSMLQDIYAQTLGPRDRLIFLELFECLMNDHGGSVISLGSDLVSGVCAAIDNETDPRCLLVAFRLVVHLGRLFPASNGPLAEGAEYCFDIIGRYFPVSFTPLPDDALGISRDDLAEALLKAFTSTTIFAPHCILLLEEKLSSRLKRAKLDSLRYLGFCVLSYGPEAVIDDIGGIWLTLKKELLPPSDPELISTSQESDAEVREEALTCLTRCVRTFQREEKGDDTQPPAKILRAICEDVWVEDLLRYVKSDLFSNSQQLRGSSDFRDGASPEHGSGIVTNRAKEQIHVTGQVLAAAMKASSSACYIVTELLLSRLLSATGIPFLDLQDEVSSDSGSTGHSYQFSGVGPLSVLGLEVVIHILEAASIVAKTIASSYSATAKSLAQNWLEPIRSTAPNLRLVFSQVALGQVPTIGQELGVAGLQALTSFPSVTPVLDEDQLQASLSILLDIFLDDSCSSNLRDRIVEAIVSISSVEKQFTPFVDDASSPILNALIPKFLEAVRHAQSTSTLKPPLQALVKVGCSRQASRVAILDGMRTIIGIDMKTLMDAPEEFASRRMLAILECLSGDIIPLCDEGGSDQRAACNIILDMWGTIYNLSSAVGQISEDVLSALMTTNRVTFRQCPDQLQEEILCRATSVLLHQHSNRTRAKKDTLRVHEVAHAWSPTVTHFEEKGWQVSLVASLAIGLRPAVVSPQHKLLLKTFVMSSISESSSIQTRAAAQATASFLNRWKDDSTIGRHDGTMDPLSEIIREVLDETLVPIVSQYLSTSVHDQTDGVSKGLDVEKVVRAVFALAWVGKGLAMRGHIRVADIAAMLLMCLQSECMRGAMIGKSEEEVGLPGPDSAVVAGAAAKCIGVIMMDCETCLNGVHNAVVKPLFKQRFFTSMLSPMQDAVCKAGKRPYRIWFFRAFAHLLSGTPHTAVLTEGKKTDFWMAFSLQVFPLVLEGLSTLCHHSQDSDLLLTTLLTLSWFLTDDNYGRELAADHIPAIVNRLAILVEYRSSWVIRETALQNLAAVVGLPFTRVFPVKRQVLKVVDLALDDRKRVVRREAVQCRQVWSAISS